MHKKTSDLPQNTAVRGKLSKINMPSSSQIPELRQLWKDTFGDSDAFLDHFFETAFSLDRCMCTACNDFVVGALYWFDCTFLGEKIAYIYAVATAKAFRGQGICSSLMEHTHKYLKEQGYAGAILSPAEKTLFDFYGKMGYETCAYTNELQFTKDTLYALEKKHTAWKQISKDEFAKLRRDFIPADAVLQENENLDFLETQAEFYAGNSFVLTAQKNGTHLHGIEFLGDTTVIPCLLQAFHCTTGHFHTMGTEKPVAMYLPFTDVGCLPAYIGFVFD